MSASFGITGRCSRVQRLATTGVARSLGIVEGGMIVAPATLCNAVEDALSPYCAQITEQHLPPAPILEIIGAIPAD